MSASITVCLKKGQDNDISPKRPVSEREKLQDRETSDSKLICATCGNHVTSFSAKTIINGSHKHVFCNPSGFVYEIGCFSSAPGCGVIGQASTEFTWFPGHTWQLALCISCQTHLGWGFTRGDSGFYGLILDRLVESAR